MSINTVPEAIRLAKSKAVLQLDYTDGQSYALAAELLRVYSPSAEVRGHGAGQEVLQTGKRAVTIAGLEPVGLYALKIAFSDGHDTGLYDWDYLYDLATNQDAHWQDYLRRLALANASRDA